MSDINNDWHVLEDVHPTTSTFPVRAKAGSEPILVFAIGNGTFRGVQRACPHLQESLSDAILMNNGAMLRCAKHNFIFKLADGKGVNCPGFRIKVFEIREEGDRLLARPG
jgi:nitrite reductase/ring-hydroxylating ferredoxin subunit